MDFEEFEPLEPDAGDQQPRDRATDAEVAEREAAALELLQAGTGTALSAQLIADRFDVSLRQARRYVRVAAFEALEPLTAVTLDCEVAIDLQRLDMITGRALAAGDEALAIKAMTARARAVAQFRRVLEPAAPRRVRLRTARTRPEIIG